MNIYILFGGFIILLLQRQIFAIHFNPNHCWRIHYGIIQDCCPFEPLYATPAFLACGVPKFQTKLASPEDCNYYACIFNKLGWMHLNGTVNYKTYKKSLDKWTEHQYNIKKSMQLAQNRCMKWPWKTIEYPRNPFGYVDGTINGCQINRLNACLRIYTQWVSGVVSLILLKRN
ncbi:unnamed protein product [Arctia plantaginis]|uniref:Uncharacterized protein n=1 Tax=Arctia plantaginis TaxID=874455 RepID=A0A8S0ZJL9_ARCPL|nr:unnamed protein product [Arctia plantaginis]